MREEEEKELITNTSNMIDVAFNIKCKTLPYDHAYGLSKAITTILPWMNENKFSGIHTLHGPDSGNGWIRSEDDEIFLSKRTRLILRIPRKHIDDAKQLEGKKINVLNNEINIGKCHEKSFLVVRDLISRFVLTDNILDENKFLKHIHDELREYGIFIKKAICGKTKNLIINNQKKYTRSLMIADLTKESCILIQDKGVGEGRIFGCGIFLPHKSIDAVANFKEE